jgi:hypothetical protein
MFRRQRLGCEFHWVLLDERIIPIGIAISYVSYGSFSRKRLPTAGVGFTIVGFIFRLAGAWLIVGGCFPWLFVFSIALGGR